MKHQCVDHISRAAGLAVDAERFQRLADWLSTEAAAAGGIGPHERDRVWDRHICDSLAYALVADGIPDRALDVGTGVGLPGLPLALFWPDTEWTLLDRSGRRVDLVRRASRVLGIETVSVVRGEPEHLTVDWPLVVSRATFPPAEAVRRLAPRVASGGRAVVGVHRGSEPPAVPPVVEGVTVELEAQEVLDPPDWFLIIRPCD